MAPTVLDPTTLYGARRGVVDVVDVPELLYAAVDGRGAPADPAFAAALKGIYTVAYGVRFALRERGVDERVSPLEALWESPDPAGDYAAALAAGGFTAQDMSEWSWTALLHLPWAATDAVVAEVRAAALRRHPALRAQVDAVRVERWREGLCAQTLHVGPYAEELETVQLLHRFVADHGYRPAGRHHEIYLGDPRRTAPQRLRTVLRQPIAPVA